MGKKQKRKKRIMPPKGASSYFSRSSDDEFKEKYPVGYKFLEVLGAVALLLPVFLYVMIVNKDERSFNSFSPSLIVFSIPI